MNLRRFVRDTFGLAASNYAARAVLLARGLLSAAALGRTGFGQWNALNLVLDYGTYAPLGVVQGLDLRLPAPTARGDRDESRRLLEGAWSVSLLGGLLFAALVAIVFAGRRPQVLRGIGWDAPLLVMGIALLQMAIQVHASALRARGRFGAVSGSGAAQALVGGGLGLALVWPFHIAGLLWGWLAGTLVALAWMRLAAPDVPLRPGAFAEGGALVRRGFVVFAFFSVSLVLRSVDRIAFIRYGTPADLGAYGLGVMAAGLVTYVPESAAAVLYPRIAAGEAIDATRTRDQVARVQAALALLLPPAVAVAMVWVAAVLGVVLPHYADAAGAVRVLVFAALLLSAGTLPGYWLLGRGRARTLLAVGTGCAVVTAALVFAVAARAPRPLPVAIAAFAGYGLFSAVMVVLAARELRPEPGGVARLLAGSFLPAAWAGGLALAACRIGPSEALAPAAPWAVRLGAPALRSLAVLLAYAPLVWVMGRGLGLRALPTAWARGPEVAS